MDWVDFAAAVAWAFGTGIVLRIAIEGVKDYILVIWDLVRSLV